MNVNGSVLFFLLLVYTYIYHIYIYIHIRLYVYICAYVDEMERKRGRDVQLGSDLGFEGHSRS